MPKVIGTQAEFCHDAPLQCKAALAGDVLLDCLCLCWLIVLMQVIVICACADARLGRYVCRLVELFVQMYVFLVGLAVRAHVVVGWLDVHVVVGWVGCLNV